MPLSWHDVALLYQSTQVLAMVLVSPLADTLRLTGPLYGDPEDDEEETEAAGTAAREAAQAGEATEAPDDEPPLAWEKRVQQRQEIICLMISGFVACIQENFTEEPRLAELRQEVAALADLL
jgi:hypothetical protein